MEGRVLLIDDDVQIREALVDFLSAEGLNVAEAADGKAGFDYLRNHPDTDIVLLDLMMPGTNGFQFLASQREEENIASIPIVIITAQRGTTATLDNHPILRKPFDVQALLDTLAAGIRAAQGRKRGRPLAR